MRSPLIPVLALSLVGGLSLATAADPKPKPPKKEPPVEKPSPRPPAVAEPRTEMRAWLGVATSPVAPVLREHLELAEGFGIQVEYVVEDSPAEKAGITARDILTKLDEQLLTTPEHLAVLVRSLKKGDKLTLTLIRKGAEQTVDVTLGENEVSVQPEWPRSYGFEMRPSPENPRQWQFHGEFPVPDLDGKPRADWQESIREYQDRLREWMEHQHPRRFQHPPADERDPASAPPRPALPLPDHATVEKPDSKPGDGQGKPPAISVRPGFPIEVFSGAGLIRIDNEQGEVSIQAKDGAHTIKIVNADGETVYEGDYDPAKGDDSLPEEARKQLKKMKLDDLKLLQVPQSDKPGDAETKTEIKIEIGAGEPDQKKGGLL